MSVFTTLIVLLLVAVLIVTIFRKYNLPVIVGYLVVGILLGPHAFGIIVGTEVTAQIAEFGVVFLLFTIGLEFSLSQILMMKKWVFGCGGLQVLLSLIITFVVGQWLGLTTTEAMIVGGIVAMSSTAIVTKQLAEQLELHTPQGCSAVGILLFQDLAVVPFLILLPNLVPGSSESLLWTLLWAAAKGVLAIAAIILLGRFLLRPLFSLIGRSRSLELFTLMVLLVTLSAAWVTHKLGLSLALGAFLAGMMLGETEFKHQIEAEIRPFRDVLLGFFFISIGTQLDLAIIPSAWMWIGLLFAALLVFKVSLIFGLARLFRADHQANFRTGIILAQGGEFGIVILALALSYQLLPADYAQVILAAILFSMALAPLLIKHNQRITQRLLPIAAKPCDPTLTLNESSPASYLQDHVVICGFGRVGQNVARLLERGQIKYLAYDLDPTRVAQARLAGDHVFYGDASQLNTLRLASIASASALVVSFNDLGVSKKIIQQVHQAFPHLAIVVRCYDETSIDELYHAGATEVIPDSIESSLSLATHILWLLKIPAHKVSQWVEETRHNHYHLLRMIYPAQDTLTTEEAERNASSGLHVVVLPSQAKAVGQAIADVQLATLGVEVVAIRRQGQKLPTPAASERLQAEDVIVLYGELAALERAQDKLLRG